MCSVFSNGTIGWKHFTICTNLITNGKEIDANVKNGNAIGTNGTNVTNQWYHWENTGHTHFGQNTASVNQPSLEKSRDYDERQYIL